MKKNIDYYPHKSNAHRHPKFKMLRSMYDNVSEGWAAEGRFWALNNLIAESEDCFLDLTKKRNKGVFADELGMSITEFDVFIELLVSEDVELLIRVEDNIYTTDTVRETYQTVASDRERARKKKRKAVNDTGSEEKEKSSEELSESSGELNNKVNKSEVNKSKLNKSEVNGKSSTFLEPDFEALKSLYAEHTRIRDPNENTHIKPLLKFFEHIPEHLSSADVMFCIEQTFKSLDKNRGLRVDLLCSNIQARISAKWEEKLTKLKEPELKEAEMQRIKARQDAKEEDAEFWKKKGKEYLDFYESNLESFTKIEIRHINKYLQQKNWIMVGTIIEPKMEKENLVED